jgi:hypothetical protein
MVASFSVHIERSRVAGSAKVSVSDKHLRDWSMKSASRRRSGCQRRCGTSYRAHEVVVALARDGASRLVRYDSSALAGRTVPESDSWAKNFRLCLSSNSPGVTRGLKFS